MGSVNPGSLADGGMDRIYRIGSGFTGLMNYRAASRAVSRIATPKNCAASCGVFYIPRKRDKNWNYSGWEKHTPKHRENPKTPSFFGI
jgi:hypothetical protein